MLKNKPKNTMRLAKFLAQAGVSSRRKAEELILAGLVKIEGRVVKDVATNVLASQNNITVKGQPVILEEKVYYLLNKPRGYICSVSDPHNDQTVIKLLPQEPKVVPVGRLDMDSEGLLLLTNDGDLTYQLTHPKFEVKKTYIATVNKKLDKKIILMLKKGIHLSEGLAQADQVKILNDHEVELVIHQGWNRQIRRMLGELGYHVESLTRIAEGKLKLGNLASGQYKKLKLEDIL